MICAPNAFPSRSQPNLCYQRADNSLSGSDGLLATARRDALQPAPIEGAIVNKRVIIGHCVSFLGTALWLYGYLAAGSPPLVNWHALTPWWIADFLPTVQSEVGMAFMIAAMVPIYWPGAPRAEGREG